jgi:hypothetical protein
MFNPNREFVDAYFRCLIGRDGLEHPFRGAATPQSQTQPVVIGNDIWIGTSVLLSSGLTIGDGAVFVSSSVVAVDIPPYVMVGRNPAKIIRFRFPQKVCHRLLRSKWWEYELSDLHRFKLSDPLETCAAIEGGLGDIPTYSPKKLTIWEEIQRRNLIQAEVLSGRQLECAA